VDEEVVQAVKAGLDWLYAEQPDNAAVTHHGVDLVAGIRRLSFVPRSAHNLPVVAISVAKQQWHRDLATGESELMNPLAEGELDELCGVAAGLGRRVDRTWNGQYESGSVGLADPAHPSLLAAVDRYRAGCQNSGPFGEDGAEHQTGSVFCRCGWMRELSQRLVRPRM
jgi:hypothetical protein